MSAPNYSKLRALSNKSSLQLAIKASININNLEPTGTNTFWGATTSGNEQMRRVSACSVSNGSNNGTIWSGTERLELIEHVAIQQAKHFKIPLGWLGTDVKDQRKKNLTIYRSFSTVCSSFWVLTITFAWILFLYLLRKTPSLLYSSFKIVSKWTKYFKGQFHNFPPFIMNSIFSRVIVHGTDLAFV